MATRRMTLTLLLAMGVFAPGPPASAADIGPFSADRAWKDLMTQCAFGPRNPGSIGHAVALRYLEGQLHHITSRVWTDRFSGDDDGRPVELTNLYAAIGPVGPHPVLLCAHWDTRPWANRDPDPAKRHVPILGADDGASGVAVALEVARVLRPRVPVRIALFDGEDLGSPPGHLPTSSDGPFAGFFQGSQRFAAKLGKDKPRCAILLDMVGQRGLRIDREVLSERSDPTLLDAVFGDARKLHSSDFVDRPGEVVYDDHYPLIEAGIPAIDLIDLDYPAWHTTYDNPDQCRAASLGAVGQVVVDVLDQMR